MTVTYLLRCDSPGGVAKATFHTVYGRITIRPILAVRPNPHPSPRPLMVSLSNHPPIAKRDTGRMIIRPYGNHIPMPRAWFDRLTMSGGTRRAISRQ